MTRHVRPSTRVIKEDSHTMNFDISSVPGVQAGIAPARGTSKTSATSGSSGPAPSAAVKVDIAGAQSDIPSSPPEEVLDAMTTASAAWEKLAETNRGLSFKIDEATGKVVVGVHDADGNLLFTVPASKALDIAGGGSLDE